MSDMDEKVDETLRYVESKITQVALLLQDIEDDLGKLGAITEKLAEAERVLRMLKDERKAAAG